MSASEAAQWEAAAGWDAAPKLRRARALAMTDDDRLRVVEEMIQWAIAGGMFSPAVHRRHPDQNRT